MTDVTKEAVRKERLMAHKELITTLAIVLSDRMEVEPVVRRLLEAGLALFTIRKVLEEIMVTQLFAVVDKIREEEKMLPQPPGLDELEQELEEFEDPAKAR